MGNIVKYVHEQFGQIRICQSEGKEWFNLHDVCKPHYNVTPLVTGKGQQYFIDIFMK